MFLNALESLLMSSEQLLDYEQAAAAVSAYAAKLRDSKRPMEHLELPTTLGRVLAAPILADRDQPPFPRSTRDGFACRALDADQPMPLEVIGQVRAGSFWKGTVEAGQAVEIMTGAPAPAGTDCVIMLEHVQREGTRIRMLPSQQISAGQNIVAQGAEAKNGDLLLHEGTRLRAQELALAAACGYTELPVYSKPRVAILATGDELVEIGRRPLPYQVRNSNSYSLAAQVTAAGGEPLRLPIAGDNLESLRTALAEVPPADMLLLSGGVSAGKYDLVEEALTERNAEFFFTGVRIQPGKPVVFGALPLAKSSPIPFFGLPGNPVSTMVTFALFVQPVLEALENARSSSPRFALATLREPFQTKEGLTRFLPATCNHKAGEVQLVPWQGSGDIAAMSRSNCYLVVPADCKQLMAGETVKILLA